MQLLDGKLVSKKIIQNISEEVKEFEGRKPHLAAVLVGSDGASRTYVNAKMKACKRAGLDSTVIRLEDSISEEELLKTVKELNENDEIDGYIVQLPLPKHIDEQKILLEVDPKKDVDGFHPMNLGKLVQELPTFIPATPFGIIELLRYYEIDTTGKNVVVIGRSNIVGKPISLLLANRGNPGNATVTICHSRTKDIEEKTKEADIVIAAIGKPNFLTGDMVKEGAVIVDVGITRVDDDSEKGYHLFGDVEFESVSKKASFITPVPGGVGPMTIAMLIKNTVLAFKNNH